MILDYIPSFNQLEPQNLKGLQAGFVVAQTPAGVTMSGTTVSARAVTAVSKNGKYFYENGLLLALASDGKTLKNWASVAVSTGRNPTLFIHYTEELNTFLSGRKYFAVEEAADPTETYLRAVQAVPGDSWVTTIPSSNTQYAAAISAGLIACVDASATMPDNTAAYEYVCLMN